MPCYDSRSHEPSIVYRETPNAEVEELRRQNAKWSRVSQLNSSLEAGLCAVFSELERRGIAADIAASASRSGLIDLMSFWEHHSEEDHSRLAKEIHKYSKDEQEVIRKILGKL